MGRAFFVFFLFGFEILSSAQPTLQKTFGADSVNDIGQSIIQTPDGGFVIAGTQFTTGNNFESLFLIRTDSSGDTLWTKLINEAFNKYICRGMQRTFDSGYILTGTKGNASLSSPFLLKTDSSGNPQWSKSFDIGGYEHMYSVVQTPDSGYLAAGYMYDAGNYVYFIRADASGNMLWTRIYGEINYNVSVYSVENTAAGGFIATGVYQHTQSQDVDVCLLKTDAFGNVEWTKSYGGPDYEYGQQVRQTSDGGFVVAATTYSYGAGQADYFLLKTDSLGDAQWSRAYGGVSDDRSESVVVTADGGYVLCGESASFSAGNFDVFLVRTDSSGDTLRTILMNSPYNSEGYSVSACTDGGFAVTGTYLESNFKNNVLLMKTDSSGSMGCGDGRSNAQVTAQSTNVASHQLSVYPTGPIVSSPILVTMSGSGVTTICLTDRVDDMQAEDGLLIFPNPANRKFRISGNAWPGSKATVTDAYGRLCFVTTLPEDQTVELPFLKPGIYFIFIEKAGRKFKLVIY